MCGLWGFTGERVDVDYLRTIALSAARRGPHGWGMAWWVDGQRQEHREFGALARSSWDFAQLDGARAIVGHSRLATSGTVGGTGSAQDIQPLAAPGIVIGHNGNVYFHEGIAKGLGIGLQTTCDSELILRSIERVGWGQDGLRAALGVIGRTPFGLVAMGPDGSLAVGHRVQPMFTERRPEGVYFGQARWPGSEPLPDDCIYLFSEDTMTVTRPPEHPIGNVRWVDPATLTANDYNPNHVFPPELRLLKTSILESGWTQPVVVTPEMVIIDGFHRWTLASTDDDIKAVSNGLVPIVVSKPLDEATRVMATVRHNRARGSHGIVAMGKIVRGLIDEGLSEKEICQRLGMEAEEVERLADFRPSTERVGQESFGKGWVPVQD